MAWSFSFHLLPGERVVEDSAATCSDVVRPAYSIFLTDRRVIFRFDGLGSQLCSGYFYDEILDVRTVRRLLVHYLRIKTRTKESFYHISDPDEWSRKVLAKKDEIIRTAAQPKDEAVAGKLQKRALLDMLVVLHRNGILSDSEFEAKVKFLEDVK